MAPWGSFGRAAMPRGLDFLAHSSPSGTHRSNSPNLVAEHLAKPGQDGDVELHHIIVRQVRERAGRGPRQLREGFEGKVELRHANLTGLIESSGHLLAAHY